MEKRSPKTGIQVARGAFSIFLANALILPTGFITAIVLAHKLGPVDYGLFALVSSIILWVEWLVFAGLSDTSVKFVAETVDWKPVGITITQLHVFVGLCTGFLLWAFAGLLAELLREPVLADYFRWFAIDIPLYGFTCAQRNILVGISRFHERARVTATRFIARLLLIVLFVLCGFSVKGAIWGSIGASVAELIFSLYFVRLPFISRRAFPVRKLFVFATPLLLAGICFQVARLDLLILKMFGGAAVELGCYSAALNISIIPVLFFSSIAQPVLTLINRLRLEGNFADVEKYILICFRSVFWLMPFTALLSGSSSEIVVLVFGPEFRSAGLMLELLIFAGLASGAIIIENTIFVACNEPKMALWFAVPMIPFVLVGNFWLIPVMGGVGTAMVKTVVFSGVALIAGIVIVRRQKINFPLLTVGSSIVCSGMAYGIATCWSTSGSLIILKLFLVTCIIFTTFALFKEIGSEELTLAKKILRFKEKMKLKNNF